MVDAVLFDLDDTIYDQALPFADSVAEVLGALPAGADADKLYQASRRHSGEVFQAYNLGKRPTRDIYTRRLRATLADFGVAITDTQAVRMQRAYAMHTARSIRLSPAMGASLERCSCMTVRGVGVVTNGTHFKQVSKYSVLNLNRWVRMQHLFISEDMDVAKPSPKIFTRACEKMRADPKRCIFVGDSYTIDVVGAHDAGMRTIWFDRRHTHMHDGMDPDLADHVVRTDDDLLMVLRALL